MRIIDADALSKAMYQEAFEKDTDMQKWDGGCWIRYKMFENKIKEAPTINCLNEILEKIRAEIEQEPYVSKMEVLEIIDNYKKGAEND